MSYAYDTNAPKRATNISVNSDLIKKAKEYRINLSKTLEGELEKIIRKKAEEAWLDETKEAAEAYNRRIEKYGTFGDSVRRF